jgi:general secretion pathway protein D
MDMILGSRGRHEKIMSENMNKNVKKTEFEFSLRWLEIAAGTTFLIGLAGLLAIMAHGAWADSPTAPSANSRPGFSTGSKAFTNPFGNAGGTSDDDEDDDSADSNAKAGATNSLGGLANPQSANGKTNSTYSMGGGPSNGVISQNDVAALQINDETGDGSKEKVTDFNFPDADIMDIARTLGKLTGKNFIYDKDVKGRISLISNSPITVGDAWRAFLTALDMSGFALIPSGKYLRIARNRDARDKQLQTYAGEFSPNTDALITRIFSLKYISADEVARTFRSFMPANSRIMSYEQTNTVIVTDTGANIGKLGKMLEILDIEGYDAGIEVIPVRWASAVELAKLIDKLLPGTGASAGGAPRFGGGSSFGSSQFSARRTKEGGLINTIIADERTNTMIVHANTKGADQVRELVRKLDQKSPISQGGGKVHVVYLQFAEAEAIATTLNNLSTGSSGGGFKPVGTTGGTGLNPTNASLFEGAIKVAADKATNSLVITASPMDFITVERVINQLDIARDEIYVECIIMEVALDKQSQFSTDIASIPSGLISNTSGNLSTFVTNPASLGGGVLSFAGGHTTQITVPGSSTSTPISSLLGLINLIQTNSKSNILATPQIIALDNTEAFFEQAENIPVPNTTTTATGISQSSISNQKVALSIKITPQINKISSFVKLKVEAKLGNIETRQLPSAVANQAYATQDRTATTTVVVADQDTVVLGGLTRDVTSDSTTKIPILGDIPILGWLFKSNKSEVTKTNLLVFLTPHIIREYEKIRAILDKKLKERDEFLETNTGGDDTVRKARDAMIRSLPDLNAITNKVPAAPTTLDSETQSGDGSVPAPGATSQPQGDNNPPPAPALAPPPPPTAPVGG